MSTSSRIVSGSLASWARIGVAFFTQLILVPVYLSYWTPELYGFWLSILAFVAIVSTLDFGHAEYLGYEFLKLGKDSRKEISFRMWSGIGLALCISILELAVIGLLVYYSAAGLFLNDISAENSMLLYDSGLLVFTLYFVWVISGYIAGIMQRALYPFGFYPRVSWWGAGKGLIVSAAPAVAVAMGSGLLTAGLVMAVADLTINLFYYYDLIRLVKKEDLLYRNARLRTGLRDYRQSLFLSGKSFLERLRHQGMRVILAPLAGAGGVAAFSTMRTGANVVMQGLGTITNPMLPELMRFLNQKDQQRTEVTFGMVWMVVAMFTPAVVVLQVFVEPLYTLWTRGSISFNPLLFALLSLGVLIYGLAQPAISVAKGNNLIRSQLFISLLAAAIVVGGMLVLVPVLGILGAAVSLVISEGINLFCFGYVSKNWLGAHAMHWPSKTFRLTVLSVAVAGVAMALIVWVPELQWLTLAISLPFLGWNIYRCWQSLPELASNQAVFLLKRIPLFRFFQ